MTGSRKLRAVSITQRTRTSAKRQRLLEAGAKHVIATEEQDLVAEVLRISEGKRVRVAFDPAGGPTLPKLLTLFSDGFSSSGSSET